MAQLAFTGGKLIALDGKLADASCLDACCDGGDAIKFVECCDGEPSLWVAEDIAGSCTTIKVGELCYRNTGQAESISDIESAGGQVLRAFNETAGDGCVTDCYDNRCRACPRECCLRAFLPRCEVTALGPLGAAQCCGLGSA